MRELLHDESKAQRFLADFILKRLGLPALKPEYQPRCFRAGSIVKGLQASLTIANPNPKLQATLAE
jgi:hypothetical protein